MTLSSDLFLSFMLVTIPCILPSARPPSTLLTLPVLLFPLYIPLESNPQTLANFLTYACRFKANIQTDERNQAMVTSAVWVTMLRMVASVSIHLPTDLMIFFKQLNNIPL